MFHNFSIMNIYNNCSFYDLTVKQFKLNLKNKTIFKINHNAEINLKQIFKNKIKIEKTKIILLNNVVV